MKPATTIEAINVGTAKAQPCSGAASGSAASLRKPYPIWHTGLEEWVLVIDDSFDDYADCRRADGSKWFAAKPLLRAEPPNAPAH